MNVNVDIIPYSEEGRVFLKFDPSANIKFSGTDQDLCIHANAEGLMFLAKVCLTLAQDDVSAGNHVHFDGLPFIDNNGIDLVIERI